MPHKRKFLSLVERVKVIEINNKNRSACKIVKDFGVHRTQVQKKQRCWRSMKTTFLGPGTVCAELQKMI